MYTVHIVEVKLEHLTPVSKRIVTFCHKLVNNIALQPSALLRPQHNTVPSNVREM